MTMTPGTSGLPVAGWYTDPQNAAQLRWWDGAQWTTHTSAVPQAATPTVATAAPAAEPSPAFAPQQGVPQYGEYAPVTPAAAEPATQDAVLPAYVAQPAASGHAAAASQAFTTQPYAAQPYASAQPYGMAPMQPRVAEGTPTTNWVIWLLVFLPLLSTFSIFAFDFTAYMRDSLTNPYASTEMMLSPGYVLVSLGSWVLYGLMVVLAFLDWRWLGQRGYQRRFHWAWAFLSSLVYVIGRSVVVKKQAGKGVAPMWVSIALTVLSFVIIIAWTVMVFSSVVTLIDEYGGVSGIPS